MKYSKRLASLVTILGILLPSFTAAEDYSDLNWKTHYYEFDLSEAKVDYSFMLNDFRDEFIVTGKDFSNFDKLLLIFKPYTSVEVKLVIANPAYPLSGTCEVGGNECTSKRARPRLAELNSFLSTADETSLIVESTINGLRDVFTETGEFYYPIYFDEVLSDDSQENYFDIYEWFLANNEPEMYELSLDPSAINEIFPDGFFFQATETRGGVIAVDLFGSSFQDDNPGSISNFSLGFGSPESATPLEGLSFYDLHSYGPVNDPYVRVSNIGAASYLGTAEDFPCPDPDGDGWGWIETIGESCLAEDSSQVELSTECIDSDGDGWGWIAATQSSCIPE